MQNNRQNPINMQSDAKGMRVLDEPIFFQASLSPL
jgi:hypothetical protein